MNTTDVSALARHLFETQGAKAIAQAAQQPYRPVRGAQHQEGSLATADGQIGDAGQQPPGEARSAAGRGHDKIDAAPSGGLIDLAVHTVPLDEQRFHGHAVRVDLGNEMVIGLVKPPQFLAPHPGIAESARR